MSKTLPGDAEVVFIGGETQALIERLKASAAHCEMINAPYAASACREAAASLQAMRARAEAAEEALRVSELEGDAAFALAVDDPGKNPPVTWKSRAEAAEARLKELEGALDERERELSEIQTAQGMPSKFTFKGKTYLRRITMVRELDGSTTRTIEVVSPRRSRSSTRTTLSTGDYNG
jgi:hypothetical protein